MFYIFFSATIIFVIVGYLRDMSRIEKRHRFRSRMINREWHGVDCNIPREPKFLGIGYQDDKYYLPEQVLFLQIKLDRKKKLEANAKRIAKEKIEQIQSRMKTA